MSSPHLDKKGCLLGDRLNMGGIMNIWNIFISATDYFPSVFAILEHGVMKELAGFVILPLRTASSAFKDWILDFCLVSLALKKKNPHTHSLHPENKGNSKQ